jgi:nicotinamidase-related amidase
MGSNQTSHHLNNREVPLLIVDVQNGFVNKHSEHILPGLLNLANRWAAIGWPIYMSQFTNFPGSQWEHLIGWHRLEEEHEIALHESLEVIASKATVFRKRTYTCLVDPFRADLETHRWDEVVICGIATDSCVLATAKDLFEFDGHQVRPIVVKDLCASHAGETLHQEGLHLIERFIGRNQIIESGDLTEPELQKVSGGAFKPTN